MRIIKQAKDPGLGEKYIRNKRVINKDGSFNVSRTGLDPSGRNMYQWLINMSWLRFVGLIFGLYIVSNALFALIYMAIGVEEFIGIDEDNAVGSFMGAFYFSTQTMTTVGYGAISPAGHLASMVAAIEAFIGFSGFALFTGLMYGRFSRPNARLMYSNNALIAPYKEGWSLQFRVVNRRNNVLMEMQARVMISYLDMETGARKYYSLPLETDFIHFFPLNWTLVHKIDEDSPLDGVTEQDLIERDAEILILLKGFDDTFGQTVHSRYSYRYDEIVFNARFVKAYDTNDQGHTIMNIQDIHKHEPVRQEVLTED